MVVKTMQESNKIVIGILLLILLFPLLTCDKNEVVVELATVNTGDVTDIETSGAQLSTTVEFDGGGKITARGVCWSTLPNPIVDDSHTSDGSGTGRFNSTITGLTPNTEYFVRAYATNSKGTAYGLAKEFTTLDGVATVVGLNIDLSTITATSIITEGYVTDDGGDPVTERGVCWNTSGDPTIADSKTSDGSGIGSFTSYITGLIPNTTYFARPYAINSLSTSYGVSIVQFTTRDGIAVLTTNSITEITLTSAISGGDITDDGGAEITARGVCWNTIGNPTIGDDKTDESSGIGSFTSSITGLSLNTTYFIRAYATNSVGTVYGSEKQFKSRDGIPSLSTTDVTDITSNSAISGGNITDSGGAEIIARGICWNTVGDPTIGDNITNDGTGLGTYSSALTELSANVTYYVRSYATNSVGTVYGTEKQFIATDGYENIDGYEYIGAIDDHLYFINNTSTSWSEADTKANEHGHLVTISSQIENDSILSMISPLAGQPHVWIGFHDSNVEGSFEWSNDEPVDYTNWNDGEPNNQNGEDYTIMHGSNHNNPGSWGDQPNSVNIYRHILEIE